MWVSVTFLYHWFSRSSHNSQRRRDHSLFKQLSKLICRGATKQINSICGLVDWLFVSAKTCRLTIYLKTGFVKMFNVVAVCFHQNHKQQHIKSQEKEENSMQGMHLKVQQRTESWHHLRDQVHLAQSFDIFYALFLFIQGREKANSFIFSTKSMYVLTWLPK